MITRFNHETLGRRCFRRSATMSAYGVLSLLLLCTSCAVAVRPEDVALIERVEENVRMAPVTAKSISLTAEQGIVSISGVVPSEEDRETLLQAIEATTGVRQVHTSLRVSPDMRTSNDSKGMSSDIEQQLAEFTDFLEGLGGGEGHSIVAREHDNVVRVSGQVDSAGLRSGVERAAREIFLGKEVQSDISIRTLPDTIVQKRVEEVMTSSLPGWREKLDLKVSQGVVKISGRVSRHEEIDRVLSNVLMTDGVRDIESTVTY